MFIKIVEKKTNNGIRRYAYLVDTDGGEEKIVKQFGAVTADEAARLKIAFTSELSPAELEAQGELEFGPAKPIGTVAILNKVFDRLKLGKFVDKYFSNHFKIPGSKMLKLLAFNQLIAPNHQKGIVDWYHEVSGLRYLLDINENDLTQRKIDNSLRHLGEIYPEIFDEIYKWHSRSLPSRERMFFHFIPLTGTYYISKDIGVRSKFADSEPDVKKEVVLDLVLDSYGYIVRANITQANEAAPKAVPFGASDKQVLIGEKAAISDGVMQQIDRENLSYIFRLSHNEIEQHDDLKKLMKEQRERGRESTRVLKKVVDDDFVSFSSHYNPLNDKFVVLEAGGQIATFAQIFHDIWNDFVSMTENITSALQGNVIEDEDILQGAIVVALVCHNLSNYIANLLGRFRGEFMNKFENVLPYLQTIMVAPIYAGGKEVKFTVSQLTDYQANTLKYFGLDREKIEDMIKKNY